MITASSWCCCCCLSSQPLCCCHPPPLPPQSVLGLSSASSPHHRAFSPVRPDLTPFPSSKSRSRCSTGSDLYKKIYYATMVWCACLRERIKLEVRMAKREKHKTIWTVDKTGKQTHPFFSSSSFVRSLTCLRRSSTSFTTFPPLSTFSSSFVLSSNCSFNR